jgi:hypothetical protein
MGLHQHALLASIPVWIFPRLFGVTFQSLLCCWFRFDLHFVRRQAQTPDSLSYQGTAHEVLLQL